MRNSKYKTGFIKIATSTAGGPQGRPLANIAFPALIDGPLKETEAKFPGVEVKAIQDACDIYGPPDLVFNSLPEGSDGALHFLLERLADCNLQPNKEKFQYYATTAAATEKAPIWLQRPYHITDSTLKATIEALESSSSMAASEAKRAPPDRQAAAMEAADKVKQAANAARAAVPEHFRSYGVITCGAALGDKAFIAAFLDAQGGPPL
jgi:hypothetical protein